MGEGISEALDQEEHSEQNMTEMPVVENDLEEQATDKQQESNQEQVVAPATTNYVTASGWVIQAPACLIDSCQTKLLFCSVRTER